MAPGLYTFTPAVADGDLEQFQVCDLVENALSLHVLPGDKPVYGCVQLPCVASVKVYGAERVAPRPHTPSAGESAGAADHGSAPRGPCG